MPHFISAHDENFAVQPRVGKKLMTLRLDHVRQPEAKARKNARSRTRPEMSETE